MCAPKHDFDSESVKNKDITCLSHVKGVFVCVTCDGSHCSQISINVDVQKYCDSHYKPKAVLQYMLYKYNMHL